jgi:peroxiredoxin
MNKKTKLLVLISLTLIMILAISGCSSTKNGGEQKVGLEDSNKVADKNIEEVNDEDTDKIGDIKLPGFNLKDLEGNDVSSSIFDDYDVTIVSIWQSTCGPCMNELEALNVIYDEYKDKGVNVIGISIDNVEVTGDKAIKKVAEILDLKFTNVIADDDYIIELINYVQGTPTAFIVGENGEFLAEPRVGSYGKDKDIESFKGIIKEIIEE